MKKAVFASLFAAVLAGCGQDATAPEQTLGVLNAPSSARVLLDYPFTLRVGKSATIVGEGLTVTFQGVPSDSRCPTGAQCVSAGNAVVQVVLSRDDKAVGAELNTNQEPTSVNHLNYNVALVSLDPDERPIQQAQYSATFWVTKTAP